MLGGAAAGWEEGELQGSVVAGLDCPPQGSVGGGCVGVAAQGSEEAEEAAAAAAPMLRSNKVSALFGCSSWTPAC